MIYPFQEDFKTFDSLVEINQPKKAKVVLDKIRTTALEWSNTNALLFSYKNANKILYALEQKERFNYLFELDSLMRNSAVPRRNYLAYELKKSLNNRYAWIRQFNYQRTKNKQVENRIFEEFDHNDFDEYIYQLEKISVENITNLPAEPLLRFNSYNNSNEDLTKSLKEKIILSHIKYLKGKLYAYNDYFLTKEYSFNQDFYALSSNFQKSEVKPENRVSELLFFYQQLELVTANSENHELWIKTIHNRLNFVNEKDNEADKDNRFHTILDKHIVDLQKYEESLILYNRKGQLYIASAQSFSWQHNNNKEDDYLKALAVLKKGNEKFPNSSYIGQNKRLLEIVTDEELSLKMFNKNHSKEKIPIQLEYRNRNKTTLFIYKRAQNDFITQTPREILNSKGLELVRKEVLVLDHKDKKQKRGKTFLLNKLDNVGEYLFVVCEDGINPIEIAKDEEQFNQTELTCANLLITDLMVSTFSNEKEPYILVTDYKNGNPIKGVKVEVFEERRKKGLVGEPVATGKTDENGIFSFKNTGSYTYRVFKKEDVHKKAVYNSNPFYNRLERTQTEGTILTDRKIYRPGQTVYFKAISYTGSSNNFEVNKGKKETFKLYDANYQEIQTLDLVYNEFGSASGSFVLPDATLLGNFRITSNNESTSFSVEEYKRPTFEVKLEKPTKETQIGDTVVLTGVAMALAGYPIQNSEVNIIVKRNRYDYRYYWYFESYYEEVILTETVKTDQNGAFEIKFVAQELNKEEHFYNYSYQVEAQVISRDGESRFAFETVYAATVGLVIDADFPNKIYLNESKPLPININNMYGTLLKDKSVEISIIKQEEDPNFLSPKFDKTEFSNFKEKDWKERFPYTESVNTNEAKNDIKSVNLKSGEKLDLSKHISAQGSYEAIISTTAKNGETITKRLKFSALDFESKKMPKPAAFELFVKEKSYNVGDTVEIQLGSSFEDAQTLAFYRNRNGVLCKNWLKLNERNSFTKTISEEDRGGIHFDAILIYNGESYVVEKTIDIPFDNKELTIETKTFRDKLKPGSQETWEFTIKGRHSEKVTAEYCAALYDASLDAYKSNNWRLHPYRSNYYRGGWEEVKLLSRNAFNFSNKRFSGEGVGYRADAMEMKEVAAPKMSANFIAHLSDRKNLPPTPTTDEKDGNNDEVIPRSNFAETAFFYPHLKTNENGEVVVSFTIPESLTKWKFMGLAHTKDMQIGDHTLFTQTQKELMVMLNAPRFIREDDKIELKGKVVNLTELDLETTTTLFFFDPATEKGIDFLNNQVETKSISVAKKATIDFGYRLDFKNYNGIIGYKLISKSKHFSDGEQKVVPVLSNKILVQENKSFVLTEPKTETIIFESFADNYSPTIQHKTYSINYTNNPAWNAVLALPYLTNYPYECTEQTFSRYFANVLSSNLLSKCTEIKSILEQWNLESTENFLSELEKNKDLKQILLTETPWVFDAKQEEKQRKNIRQLFDINRMANERSSTLRKLVQKQNQDGGFSWFGNGKSNLYVTQHILLGIAQLNTLTGEIDTELDKIKKLCLDFCLEEYYKKFLKLKKEDRANYTISQLEVHWLLSSLGDYDKNEQYNKLKSFYLPILKKQWAKFDLQTQAMIGSYLKRSKEDEKANVILASFQDRIIENQNSGAYFAENQNGYYWHNNQIETQATIIDFYAQMGNYSKDLENLKLWLILHKKGNKWESTKGTTHAIYSLISSGANMFAKNSLPTIKVGNTTLVYKETSKTNEKQVKPTAGAGEIHATWTTNEITKDLGKVEINKTNKTPSIGAINWSYLERLDQINSSSNGITLSKTLMKKVKVGNTFEFREADNFVLGDEVKIVLKIEATQDLEFIHIKDLRASGLEPGIELAGNKSTGNLYYYKTTKDASTNFFLDYLPKGNYEISYTLTATNKGEFNSGTCSAQCMYAPEFTSYAVSGEIIIK